MLDVACKQLLIDFFSEWIRIVRSPPFGGWFLNFDFDMVWTAISSSKEV